MVKGATARVLCVVLVTTSLGGCGRALELLGLRHEAKPQVNVRTASAGDAGAAVAEGRAHLAAGRTGQAIEQFQRALASGQQIAPAANGMGVAYARLGQFEQAHRFFAQALAVDPQNEMYKANMGRLMRSSLLAQRHESDFAGQVAARTLTGARDVLSVAPEAKVAAQEPREQQSATRGGLMRVSRGEVMIRTGASATTPRAGLPVVGARGSKADNFRPAVRIEFSDHGKPKPKAEDNPAAEDAKDEAPAKTAEADIEKFKPLVRIDFPASRNRP